MNLELFNSNIFLAVNLLGGHRRLLFLSLAFHLQYDKDNADLPYRAVVRIIELIFVKCFEYLKCAAQMLTIKFDIVLCSTTNWSN